MTCPNLLPITNQLIRVIQGYWRSFAFSFFCFNANEKEWSKIGANGSIRGESGIEAGDRRGCRQGMRHSTPHTACGDYFSREA